MLPPSCLNGTVLPGFGTIISFYLRELFFYLGVFYLFGIFLKFIIWENKVCIFESLVYSDVIDYNLIMLYCFAHVCVNKFCIWENLFGICYDLFDIWGNLFVIW